MQEISSRLDGILRKLRELGFRITPQRLAILMASAEGIIADQEVFLDGRVAA